MLLCPSWQLCTVEPLLSSQLPEMAVRSGAGVGAKKKRAIYYTFSRPSHGGKINWRIRGEFNYM